MNDNSGNFIALDIECGNIHASLALIYGPNDDSPGFYDMVLEAIGNFENESIV